MIIPVSFFMKTLSKLLLCVIFFQNFIFFSNSANANTLWDNQTGNTLTNGDIETIENSTIEEEVVTEQPQTEYENLDIEIELQSWLELWEDWHYICKKEDCKVNLTIEKSLEVYGNISNFLCEWDFWWGTWTTADTDKKCNPWFVQYLPGKYSLSISVSNKQNWEVLWSQELQLENTFYTVIESPEKLDENESSPDSKDLDPPKEEAIENTSDDSSPIEDKMNEIWILIQSGLTEYEEWGYRCNNALCKINLSLDDYIESLESGDDYSCVWDFWSWSWSTTGTDIKCNPWYVSYQEGQHNISVEIRSKNTDELINTFHLIFDNIIDIDDEDTTDEDTEEYSDIQASTSNLWSNQEPSETSSGETFMFPEITFNIQSGLIENETESWTGYICKNEDCKVNLTVEHIFTGSFLSRDYICKWNFWSGSYIEGTQEKCNPGYVSYGTGYHVIELQLLHVDNSDIFSSGALYFSHHMGTNNEPPFTNIDSAETWSIEEEVIQSENKTLSEINFELSYSLQQPSYVTEEKLWLFLCDSQKEECKVNFLFEITTSDNSEKSYTCNIDVNGQSQVLSNCNPATLTFPQWDNKIDLHIIEKNTVNVITTKSLIVSNHWYTPVQNNSGGWSSSHSTNKEDRLQLSQPHIEVQSGLDDDYICKKQDCNINLIYHSKDDEKCEWAFPKGIYLESTASKCNPGYVKYPDFGFYSVKLKVYDTNYPDNFVIEDFTFRNIDPQKLINTNQLEKNWEDISVWEDLNHVFSTQFEFELQWRTTDYKTFSGTTIHCSKSPCNINLNGSKSSRSHNEKVNLIWFFPEEIYHWNNPKAFWFESGEYQLKVSDGANSEFINIFVTEYNSDTVWVIWNAVIEEDTNFSYDPQLPYSLQIHTIIPNPKWVDNHEYIELINVWAAVINLKNLIIDDITTWGSKQYLVKNELHLWPGQTIRFYKSDTKINLNNDTDSVNISYNEEIVDSISWNFKVPNNFQITRLNTGIQSQEIEIIRIIDGDTVEIQLENWNLEKLRLVWVDTPEVYGTPSNIEKFYWEKAKQYTTQRLLGKTLQLELEHTDNRDIYGRLLWYIVMEDETNFNMELIAKWYSRAYLRYDFKYSISFNAAQTNAKKQKIGIWANTVYKKISNQAIKTDKEVYWLLEDERYKNEKEYFYQDLNSNSIPDIFEKHTISLENTGTWKLKWEEGEANSWNIYIENTQDTYKQYINKQYYIKASLLLSWIKISWKTLPSAHVSLTIGETQYETLASDSGDFEILIQENYPLWSYSIKTTIKDIYKNSYEIDTLKTFIIDEKYISKLKVSEYKKALVLAKKLSKKKRAKSTKAQVKTKTYSSIFINQAQAWSDDIFINPNSNRNLLTFLFFSLLLIMSFFVLRRKKLV